METKSIRKIIFNFENRDSYRYDVHQSIKIIDLKKILETGLQIPRFKVRLYHESIEYTNLDESKIQTLFPNLSEIIFRVSSHPLLSSEQSEKEIALRLKLGYFCKLHENKYPCHFCFDCNESFCSICHKNSIHSEHETIEKYDYLQDSDFMVERIFKKLTGEISLLKLDNLDQVNAFEVKLKSGYFETLRLLLIKIEDKARELLRMYSDVNLRSFKQIEDNLKKVKKSCVEALANKKEELQMQNIIIDESIVVSYYNTILQIHNQKQLIYNDMQKYLNSINNFSQVTGFIENVTRQVSLALDNILHENEHYNKCEREIKKNEIRAIDVDQVKTLLYKDIINSTSKKPMSHSKIIPESPFTSARKGLNTTVGRFHHLDDGYVPQDNINFNINKNNNQNFYFPINNIDFSSHKKLGVSNNYNINEKMFDNNHIENLDKYPNMSTEKKPREEELSQNKIESQHKILNHHELDVSSISNNHTTVGLSSVANSSGNIFAQINHEEKKLTNTTKFFDIKFSENKINDLSVNTSNIFSSKNNNNFIFDIIPKTNQIVAYNESNKVMKILEVNFPLIAHSKVFLENSSYLNVNGKIYISGGLNDGIFKKGTNELFYFDPYSNSLKILNNLKEPRFNHSMIYNNNRNLLYIIGGESTTTTEIFNLEKLILEVKTNKNYEVVDNPILFIHKNYLYSFFGKKNGKFLDIVQRVNLNSENFNWEKVEYNKNNENDFNLRITNSELIPFPPNETFFFGGKTDSGISKEIFIYDFDSRIFKKSDLALQEAHHFNNSQFYRLDGELYALFSAKEKENLIKIDFTLA